MAQEPAEDDMTAKNEYGLTPQQEKFAQEVAKGLSLAAAYREAYPLSKKWKDDSVHNKASALARKAQVAARVSAMQSEAAANATLEAAEVLRQVNLLVTSDIVNICHADGRIKLPHELDAATRAAVKSFKLTKDGIEYQFWDKNSALEKAMKHLGLFGKDNGQKTDRIAEALSMLSGNVLGPVTGATATGGPGEYEDDDA